jgi:hypothetical protein
MTECGIVRLQFHRTAEQRLGALWLPSLHVQYAEAMRSREVPRFQKKD